LIKELRIKIRNQNFAGQTWDIIKFWIKGGKKKIKFTKESKTKIKIKTIRAKFEKKLKIRSWINKIMDLGIKLKTN